MAGTSPAMTMRRSYSPSSLDRPRAIEVLPHLAGEMRELLAFRRRHGAWPGEVDVDLADHTARPRRHHQDAVGEVDGFGYAVRDEQHCLAPFHPDALQLGVHLL